MITKVEVTCEACGKEFTRAATEVRRSKKLGRRTFCSRKCTGTISAVNLPPPPTKGIVPPQLRAGNRRDQYSPFRQHLRNMKQRNKPVEVTLEDLKEVWDRQSGRCPYTDWDLHNPQTTSRPGTAHHPRRASVDRKDPAKGYTKVNIQFVSLIAQYAKHLFSDDDLVTFCEAVVSVRESHSL